MPVSESPVTLRVEPTPVTLRVEADVVLSLSVRTPTGWSPAAGTAVVAHGAGSGKGFVDAAFGPALHRLGRRLVAYDLRGHGRSTPVADVARLSPAAHVADLVALTRTFDATLVGGVSMGAHAALFAAAQGRLPDLAGLLLVMPAWTGSPDVVAAANAVQAAELRRVGTADVLARITREHPGWVADELAGSWPGHDATAFAAVLDALAASDAPTPGQLAGVEVPAGLVALADDPMHPAGVAETWAAAMPHAALRHVAFDAPAASRAVLGDAAVDAWQEASRQVSGSR